MRFIIKNNYDELSYWVACYVKNRIMNNVNKTFVLGLPTGSTPIGMYKHLVNFVKRKELTFKHVVTFNMDEYVGLDKTHKQSYHYFMYENLFNHIDIEPTNINILNGKADDLNQECIDYENKIKSVGGIDLMLGGLGKDGHIAFNEPGSSLTSKTRIKTLNDDTIEANSRFFNTRNEVPKMALTIGIQTIMDSREVLILVSGSQKAYALEKCVEQSVNHMHPGSILQMHEKSCFIVDRDSTEELKAKTIRYFKGLQRHIDYLGNPVYNNIMKHINLNERNIIFSPHPDDDVIGMGTFIKLYRGKKNIRVAYMTSGENGLSENLPKNVRETEAFNSLQSLGLNENNMKFMHLPFYNHKITSSDNLEYNEYPKDIKQCRDYIKTYGAKNIFICSDIDPNGTHKICFDILKNAVKDLDINCWMYKGAWGKFNYKEDTYYHIYGRKELKNKLNSIKMHKSQYPPKFPGNDNRSFDERIIDYNKSELFPGEYEERFRLINSKNLLNFEIEDI